MLLSRALPLPGFPHRPLMPLSLHRTSCKPVWDNPACRHLLFSLLHTALGATPRPLAGRSLPGSENGLLAESGISHGGCRLERARGKRSRHRPHANGTAPNTGRRSCTGGILGLHMSSSAYSNKCGCSGHGRSQARAVSAGGSAVLAQSVHPSSK